MVLLTTLCDKESGFEAIALKKIEDGNRFLHYEKINNIIHEVKDVSTFILRFLKLDLLL